MATVEEMFARAWQFHQSNDLIQAEQLYRHVLQIHPRHADAWCFLGAVCQARGQLTEAERSFRRALELAPRYVTAHNCLGILLANAGKLAEAETHFREACAAHGDDADAWNNLGLVLARLEREDEALVCYQQALRLQPHFAAAHYNRGLTLESQGKFDEAGASYREALRCRPDYLDALHSLATALVRRGQGSEALACCQQALRLNLTNPDARRKRVVMLLEHQMLDAAREELRRLEASAAIGACLDYLEGLLFTARTGAFDAVLEMARTLFPRDGALEAVALARLRFDETLPASELAERHVRWTQAYFPEAAPLAPRVRAAGAKVRVAYVGSYLHHMFMDSVFRWHDYERFDVTVITDDCRLDLRSVFPRLQVSPLAGTDLVRFCRDREIDLAIDVVGLSPFRNGLAPFSAFQKRLAPVQATWIVTPGTTGSRAYDYLIADWQLVGSADEDLYVERPARLPEVAFCWTPPARAPDAGPPPAQRNGYVTFGSANRGFKLNAAQLRLWAELLDRCPGSRLALKGIDPGDREFAERLQGVLRERRIAPDRVVSSPFSRNPLHLSFYQEIDIALDTYPYNGHITTLEALWMGVPVVTRFGRTLLSRCSRSILTHLGFAEWIVASEEEYVRCAARLAAGIDGLAQVRGALRSRLSSSAICNGNRFMRQLESLFLEMIRNSDGPQLVPCARTHLPSNPA